VKANGWARNPKGLHHLTRREALLAFLYNKPKEVQPSFLTEGEQNLNGIRIFHISKFIELLSAKAIQAKTKEQTN
jgi:hypothetical protein